MATITHAGATWNTTAGNKTVTATPAVGDLIVVIAGTSGLSGGTTAVTDNNSSGTYTQVDSDRTGFSTTGTLTVWVRNSLIGAASSTIFTAAQGSSTGGGLSVLRISGMTRTAALAVRGNGGQSSGGAGTTPAPVLSATPLTGNPIITAVANGATAASMTQPGSYTEHFDNGYSTPGTGLDVASINSGITNATITWGSTSATAFASVAIELDTSAIPGPEVTAFETSDWTGTGTPKTITVTGALDGDQIVVLYGGDNGTGGTNVSAATVSTTGGSTGSWTEPEEGLATTNQAWISSSTTDVTADGTVTVSLARTQSTGKLWGGMALLCRNHGGIGVHARSAPSATETASLTVAQDSAVGVLAIDWDALATVAFSPSGATDVERAQAGGGPDLTYYAGYWLAQASGTRGYGIATSSTTNLHIIAIEILAASAGETGTALGDFGFTGTAAGVPRTSGAAAGSFGFTATAAGIDRALGAAVGSFGFTATASGIAGTPPVTGQAVGAFGFTGSASGVPKTSGAAAGIFGFTAAAQGIDRALGVAVATFGFTATASGRPRALGLAVATFGFTGSAAGIDRALGQALGSFGFTGAAQGFAGTPPVTGAATGLFGFTATAQGQPRTLGAASAGFGFTATAAGRPRVYAVAVATFGFTATAAGIDRALGVAVAAFGFIGAAAGTGPVTAGTAHAATMTTPTGVPGSAGVPVGVSATGTAPTAHPAAATASTGNAATTTVPTATGG